MVNISIVPGFCDADGFVHSNRIPPCIGTARVFKLPVDTAKQPRDVTEVDESLFGQASAVSGTIVIVIVQVLVDYHGNHRHRNP